ncbi:MAG: GNVR domain-containing protein [Gemmatimonadaceae bacterium]
MTSTVPPKDQPIGLAELVAELRLLAQAVWAERRSVLRLMSVTLAIGLFVALGSGEEYSAKTRILPYRSGVGSVGGLSGLAGLAGIRLPAGTGDQTITADLYPEVAKSQDFRIAVAETPVYFSSLGRSASTVEYFRDLRKTPITEWIATYTLGLPGEVASLLRPSSAGAPVRVPTTDSVPRLVSYDRKYLKLVKRLDKRLAIAIDKRTSVITISGQMPDPYAAADLVRVTSDQLMEYIIDYESRKAGEQFRFVNEQFQQAKVRYEASQRALASFADRNRVLMSATAQIDRDRLQRDFDLAFEVYQQFSRELEQARIKMNQDTPVFTVLEQVSVPTDRTSPRRAQIVLMALFIGALIGVGRIGLRQLLREV